MSWNKETEIKLNNEIVSPKVAWLLKSKHFDWPCLHGYNARMEHESSDGTWFFTNSFMREACAPTRGMLAFWLKQKHNKYINHKLKDEDFITALESIPPFPMCQKCGYVIHNCECYPNKPHEQ